MNKPVIVLSPQNMAMEAPFRGNYNYSNTFNTEAILRAGGLPVIPAMLGPEEAEELMGRADGLFLTGGADVCPERYGEEKLPTCGSTEPARDASDFALLEAALKLQKPVLCICRGFQIANVFFGGTLWQDLPTQLEGELGHRQYDAYDVPVHPVAVLPGTPLDRLFPGGTLPVNSVHHQAIRRLAPGLRPMAVAPDGIVESFLREEGSFLRGYQWHPEMLKDPAQGDRIFGEFLEACR